MKEIKIIDLEITKAHMNASGWALENHFSDTPFDAHVFYLFDFRTNTVKLFTVPMLAFDSVVTNIDPEISGGVISELSLIMQGKSKSMLHDSESKMAHALSVYIKSTNTYRVWKQTHSLRSRIHCLLHIYSQKDNQGATIRPAIFGAENPIAEYEQVKGFSEMVVGMDKQNPKFAHCSI